MERLQYKLDSKIGPLYFVTSSIGLVGIFWKKQKSEMIESLKGPSEDHRHMRQAINEVTEYLDGKRKTFDLTLDIHGTEFQKKVWSQLQKIPYGKTLSYKQVAEKVGTNGIRAVGTANGRNPLSLVIPCHRVIATGGGLGGYAGGLPIKEMLLNLEQGKTT